MNEGQTLEDILPEAFAVVREASRRTLKMRPFDVQLVGAMVLHNGKIAEMKTGEGKTLVATLPAYLNALEGKGVHIVTVNDYLASRDAAWMGPVFEFCGLSVGLIVHDLTYQQRKEAYACDITYATNNELGFDYLRDNMVVGAENMVQRPLNYAIIDEVDSILIDEARTPLIISGEGDKPTDLYVRIAKFIPRLINEDDYKVDEKASIVTLTEEGVRKTEKHFAIDNLSDNMEIAHHVNQGLRAHTLMKKDRDYVVKDDQIIIVDEFTGRLMFGRRYSDGLHQAIEAKEGVKIEKESQTLATITFQNYFRMYKKLAGMTGTAKTEEDEFRNIYGMDVVVIPTNLPMARDDSDDWIYRSEQGKFAAVVEDIIEKHKKGQPVLVGTISIEKSELLSSLLTKKGVKHQVLNAKHHEKEAQIIAQAGQPHTVTIATNMAGRGTDILLGGNPDVLAEEAFCAEYGCDLNAFLADPEKDVASKRKARERAQELKEKYREITQKEREQVLAVGGLHILGTERHEARRIDNQLRGRAGRQGDPGSSQFFVSLEDDLMRLFGGESIFSIMERLGLDEDTPIDHPMISKALESAQKKVENRNFETRKHILEYDNVINEQREVIYRERRRVLEGENLRNTVLDWVVELLDEALARYADEKTFEEEWNLPGLLAFVESTFLLPRRLKAADLQGKDREEIRELLVKAALAAYEERERKFGEENMRELERVVILRTVDTKWMLHIDAMDMLRHEIGLRAYGQRDPLVEYKYEAKSMFDQMIHDIREDAVLMLYRVRLVGTPERRAVAVTNDTAPGAPAPRRPVRSQKIGRNDPCPCGSGKKYKKCCGK